MTGKWEDKKDEGARLSRAAEQEEKLRHCHKCHRATHAKFYRDPSGANGNPADLIAVSGHCDCTAGVRRETYVEVEYSRLPPEAAAVAIKDFPLTCNICASRVLTEWMWLFKWQTWTQIRGRCACDSRMQGYQIQPAESVPRAIVRDSEMYGSDVSPAPDGGA